MKNLLPALLHWAIVIAALLRGIGEFVSLQRWRFSDRRARH